jgi:DNA replication protein DnaC
MTRMSSENVGCQQCNGTGWILESSGGRKLARPCDCRATQLQRGKLEAAGVPERYGNCTIDNFNGKGAELAKAKQTAREFVDRFPFVDAGLLFIGPSGLGKTHLACAILSELVSTKGVRGLYADSSSLLNRVAASFRPDAEVSRDAVLGPFANAELIVLDEIGATPPHPWVQDVLYDLLNTRYNRKKTTIVTTNYSDDPDAAAGARITLEDRIGYRNRSRLYEMCLEVTLRGEDFRKQVLSAQIRSRF